LDLDGVKYEVLLERLADIQNRLKDSRLSKEDRIAFWTPIAECYVRVQNVLREKILPLKERKLIRVGDTITLSVRIECGLYGRFLFHDVELPRFEYALERTNFASGECYLDQISCLDFLPDYGIDLPDRVKEHFIEGTMDLPLKVVSEAQGQITAVEIDIPAFLAMFPG
jgi:hypothetical protein